MVAKITMPHSIAGALSYNEQKVKQYKATCICAVNFLQELQKMNFYPKIAVFENLNILNDRASTKTLHVLLNFDPSEKLSDNRLTEITECYMEKIGFSDQPYLIYRHINAGHPHIHIVSTTIRQDGSRINTHNIGRNQSEEARKELEQQFGLIRAEGQKRSPEIKPFDNTKIIYGKVETKRSISNVLNSVVNTSIAELNAVLKQYNVIADRGEKEGRIYKSGGLVYRILNEAGTKIGVPIKASAISSKPTLARLEKKFEANKGKRELPKHLMKKLLEEVLQCSPANMKELIALLAKKKVFTVLRQNEEGRLYGITFVDNQNKAVLNGSELGKLYSITSLQSCFSNTPQMAINPASEVVVKRSSEYKATSAEHQQQELQENKTLQNSVLLLQLMIPEKSGENVPAQLLKKNKKRKKVNKNL